MIDICTNMDKSHKYAEQKTPDPKDYILYDSVYMEF